MPGLRRYPTEPWRSARVERAGGGIRIAIGHENPWVAWLAFLTVVVFFAVAEPTGLMNRLLQALCAAGVVWFGRRSFVLGLGREVVGVNAGTMTIRREVAGMGQTHRFERRQVRNLQLTEPPGVNVPPPIGSPAPQLPPLPGCIKFQYGSGSFEFGLGLGWADTEIALDAVRDRVRAAGGTAGTD